jgi:spore coat polysaccharide biosynthesis protein SpsF
MRTVAIVQARMGSTRLPGKVLMDLHGEPMLARCVGRVRRAQSLDQVVVATTTEPEDDVIEGLCVARGWACFRGSEPDVLDRYYRAACAYRADAVVRITSDCPLIDPGLIDHVAHALLLNRDALDYVSNFVPRRTFPRGLDAEAISFAALERSWCEDDNPAWREHVNEYVLHHPQRFRIRGVTREPSLGHMRWTVDTGEDLEFVRRVFAHLGPDDFDWHEVLELVRRHPDWSVLNAHVRQKQVV